MFNKITNVKCNTCVIGKKEKKGKIFISAKNIGEIRRGSIDAEVLIVLSIYETDKYIDMFELKVNKFCTSNYVIVSGIDCSIQNIKDVTKADLYTHCNAVDLDRFPNIKVIITIGSGLYAITKTKDISSWREFREYLFNQTYFYTPFDYPRTLRVYPFPFLDELDNWDSFERFFADKQLGFVKEHLEKGIDKYNKNYKINHIEDPNQFLKDNMGQEIVAWDTETSSLKHYNTDFRVGCITMCFDGINGYYLSFDKINKPLLNEFFDKAKTLVGAGVKFDVKAMYLYGIDKARVDEDIILLYRMLNTSRKYNNLGALAWLIGFSGYDKKLHKYIDKFKIKNYLEIPKTLLAEYAVLDAIVTFKLYKYAIDNLVPKQPSIYKVYKDLVIPVYPAFIEMESEGIKIDIDYLNKLDAKYFKKQKELEKKILNMIGRDINVGSNEQLAKELERLKLPNYGRTKKKFFNTGNEILLKWKKDGYEIADLILQHRQIIKLRTGFIGEVFEEENDDIFFKKGKKDKKDIGIVKSMHSSDGKIHPSYGIAMTEPGRQWCSGNNIQQFPSDSEIRKIFDFEEDYLFGEFDVAGFHLRLMAFVSNDEAMRDVFLSESPDLHSSTGFNIFCNNKFIDTILIEDSNGIKHEFLSDEYIFVYRDNKKIKIQCKDIKEGDDTI